MRAIALAVAAWAACGFGDRDADAPGAARVRLWHTFQPHEAEALNLALGGRAGPPVEVTLLPFARGMMILRELLPAGEDCPDLVRIDSTWLPGLARAGLLAPAPPHVFGARRWLSSAAALATDEGEAYGVPQSLDGLALLTRPGAAQERVPWPPASLDDLASAARRLAVSGGDGIDVRVDGYWFVAFLRARGGHLLDPATGALGIDEEIAARALDEFAALFRPGGPAPRPPAPGDEERDEVRRFRSGAVAIAVSGPWALHDLTAGNPDAVEVTPFPPDPRGHPAAPRGGMVFAVPRCAAAPEEGWRLALDLTAPALQADWSRRFGVVPTTEEALGDAGDAARGFYRALERAQPLPRHPLSAEIFDDLTPAIAAVVAGHATSEEALAGVGRAWQRLLERHRAETNAKEAPP